MKERPILFSAPMVRALLAGAKTQTRREFKAKNGGVWPRANDKPGMVQILRNCPYGQPGDRLWVRESHYLHGIWSVRKDDDGKRRWTFHPNPDMGAQFTEPNGFIKGRSTTVAGWYRRPSIHMPRWASRITLEVTGVRVERLQDISEADARAEGITDGGCLNCGNSEADCGCLNPQPDARDSFVRLWESINGPDSWAANPWVWCVSFRRV